MFERLESPTVRLRTCATSASPRASAATDASDRWIGGKLVVVQTGDQLDRGDQEREIVDLFDRLVDEAAKAGGAVHPLNGNHEIMNVALDFRYVTPAGFSSFEGVISEAAVPSSTPPSARARAAAFAPGGPYARKLAKRNVVAIVGETVFVHGGLLPKYASYGIEKLNQESRAWMRGELKAPSPATTAEDGPVWARHYSHDTDKSDCELLTKALETLGAKRMVIGHTVQKGGITSECEERVFRIDVGLAAVYGGPLEALEIAGGRTKVLKK